MRRTLAAALLAALTGCTGPVYIERVVDPRDESGEGALTLGIVDLAFAWSYEATFDVVNEGYGEVQLDAAELTFWLGGRAEGDPIWERTAHLDQRIAGGFDADVDVVVFSEYDMDTLVLYRFSDLYGSIDDIPIGELGYKDLVTIRARLSGEGVGDAAELTFNLGVCHGCLVTCPPESTGPSGERCEATTAPDSVPERLGQDERIDCRLCVPHYDAERCRDFCEGGPF